MADIDAKDEQPDDEPDDVEPVQDETPDIRRCPHCKTQVSGDAETCPRCGRDLTIPPGSKWFAWVLLIVLAILIVGGIVLWATS